MTIGHIVTWQGKPMAWRKAGRLVPAQSYSVPAVTLFQKPANAREAIRQTLIQWQRMSPSGNPPSGESDFAVLPVTSP